MKTIGIVGGSGFIGMSLAKHLSKKFHVKILDVNSPSDLGGQIDYSYCDVRNYDDVKKGLEDTNLVIHAAIIQIPLITEQKSLGYDVNFIGTQNVCKAVEDNPNISGLLLVGSWHTVGEQQLKGRIDEVFGFRPDKVEDRARLYALSKIAQESIVRFYDEMSDKIYGVLRMGTVLGEGMPEKTAASIFIKKGLRGEPITPYKHSMYRPMLYINIKDICRAFELYSTKIINGQIENDENSLAHVVNVYSTEPITIFELAEIVKDSILKFTNEKVKPEIKIVDNGIPPLFTKEDKEQITVNLKKANELLGLNQIKSPRESIEEVVKLYYNRLSTY